VEKTIGLFGKKAKEGTMTLEDMVGGKGQNVVIAIALLDSCTLVLCIKSRNESDESDESTVFFIYL
jgi:hypothetical protein